MALSFFKLIAFERQRYFEGHTAWAGTHAIGQVAMDEIEKARPCQIQQTQPVSTDAFDLVLK